MPRFIPPGLFAHLQQPTTTTAYLLRVTPVTPGYPAYGVTTLDRDVVYDDGDGELVYSAAVGFQPTALQGGCDLSVDNAETSSLMPIFDIPVSEADIRAGMYDFARFRLYLVNYEELPEGHVELRAGTLGRVRIDTDGLSFVPELRGLAAELRQTVCEKFSLSCRATFGSQPAGSATPGPIERFPCGFDATSILRTATVLSVGLENTLTFDIAPDSGFADNSLNPGLVFWLTGLNANRANEIGSNTAGGEITLAHETDWPIQVGDTLQYREDCSKVARDEEKGCKHWFGTDWVRHFRGEPDIPIGDAGALETPGASSGPGLGAYVQIPFETEAE